MIESKDYVSRVDMLRARENRAAKQNALLEKGQCIISFTMIIPGAIKISNLIKQGFDTGKNMIAEKLVKNKIDTILFESRELITGPEGFWVLNAKSVIIKQLMIEIEELKDIGRLFDIDVIDSEHRSISRTQLGLQPRKCLICEYPAHECSRSRRHDYIDLIEKTYEILKTHI